MSIQQSTTVHVKNCELKRFEARVRQLQGPLFAYLGRLGFDHGVAEELAQETFLLHPLTTMQRWRNLMASVGVLQTIRKNPR